MEKQVEILDRSFYANETLEVAKNLLGKIVIHETKTSLVSGYIVETEAYNGVNDPACHSFNHRKTKKNEMMYSIGGTAYVYQIYGIHYCFNVVTKTENDPEAVLIRAIKPIQGIEAMVERRKIHIHQTKDFIKLSNGPGKLCQAMGINKTHNGADLCAGSLCVAQSDLVENFEIHQTSRVNVDYAGEAKNYPWRFYIKNNPFISKI